MNKTVSAGIIVILLALITIGVVLEFYQRKSNNSKEKVSYYPQITEGANEGMQYKKAAEETSADSTISYNDQFNIDDLSHLDNDILRTLSLELECAEQLNSVLPHDIKIAAKHDIPEEDLDDTSSKDLCKHFARSPMKVWFGMYDNRNMGITRALRGSKTLGALFSREDIIEAIIETYKSTSLDLNKMQGVEPGTVSTSLMITDEFLMYPPVFQKVSGYEKQILILLCNRIKDMEKVNSESPEAIYGAPYNSSKDLALLLVERIDQNLFLSLKAETDVLTIFNRIENTLLTNHSTDI